MAELKHSLSSVSNATANRDGVEIQPLRDVITQPSKLFSSLISPPPPGHRLTVLEIGSALPETVDYFSKYRCRLHFLDLFSGTTLSDLQQLSSPRQIQDRVHDMLALPEGSKIDVCLFWDFLCYLDDKALRAFNLAIRPYLHREARAHGFGVHHRVIKLANRRYGILDDQTLSIRPSHSPQAATIPHTQVETHDLLSCFDFQQGLRLPDGKLEILMKARAEAFVN